MRISLFLIVAVTFLAGCTSSSRMAQYETVMSTQRHELDSLYAAHRTLQRDYAGVLDTLQFYDDVETGRIYRQIRSLDDRINRLEYDLSIARDGGLTVETMLADDLFAPASADLSPKGMERLAELAEILNGKHAGRPVRIEGHSDSVPVGGSLKETYPSNWELSTARAGAVVRYFIDQQQMDEARFEVVGYGSTRPTASNATAQGRRQNRRIRIAVLPASAEQTASADRSQ